MPATRPSSSRCGLRRCSRHSLTTVGVLVQADVLLHASADANERALASSAYLWDPWFVVWGLLVAALLRGRRHRS